MSSPFTGSIVALVTPMHADGSIDWDALDGLLEWHLASGTKAIVSVGTTGESATLDVDEHLDVVKRCVEVVAGRCPVIAGTGANATNEAIFLTREAERLGADACLLVTPYYNRPTQSGLVAHYDAIAESVALPLILYNVPSRTACDMLPETVARLSVHPRIVGIKEASGEVSRVSKLRALCPDDFVVLSGEDALTMTMFELGALGVISVTANAVPEHMSRFCDSFATGEVAQAQMLDDRLQPLHAALFVEPNPIPVKWALYHLQRIEAGIRLPLQPLSAKHQRQVRKALELLREEEAT